MRTARIPSYSLFLTLSSLMLWQVLSTCLGEPLLLAIRTYWNDLLERADRAPSRGPRVHRYQFSPMDARALRKGRGDHVVSAGERRSVDGLGEEVEMDRLSPLMNKMGPVKRERC